MPFVTPWAKRRNQAVESREGCRGAIGYKRRVDFLLKEFIQLTNRISEQRSFTSSDYAKARILLHHYERLDRSSPESSVKVLHARTLR